MSKPQKNRMQKNWFEWTVFAAGLVLLTATLSYLAYDGATLGDAPPSIEIRLGAPARRAQNFIVPVSIVNHGDLTAEGVEVEVVLRGASEERGEFVVAFLPRGATREGWVAFQTDPRAGELKARVVGYEKP